MDFFRRGGIWPTFKGKTTKDESEERFLDCVAGRPERRDESKKRPATPLGMTALARWSFNFCAGENVLGEGAEDGVAVGGGCG